jgi:hypothetical protein
MNIMVIIMVKTLLIMLIGGMWWSIYDMIGATLKYRPMPEFTIVAGVAFLAIVIIAGTVAMTLLAVSL